ncbi:MAG: adenosylcobalamin-dependent ribonucleoside-diphosphate reductase [Proteobacteria bacterium]|nr:adenosylcobalamin-dependent ribonucleoside-diphosphate reductase [Pseudomonadota bacterium]
MRAYDTWAAVMQSGGRQRRAARMQTLDCEHPDLIDFVSCKMPPELRAAVRRRFPGLPWHSGIDAGDGAGGVSKSELSLANTTISVRLSDEFLRAAESGAVVALRRVVDGTVIYEVNAREVLELIVSSIHACGEPGIQFSSTINSWHTVPSEGAIRSSNPCSEFQFIDDSACNLASINLVKYYTAAGEIDWRALTHTVRVLVTAQDMLVDAAGYPSEAVARNSRQLRPIGLGVTNLGALLMRMGLPYDSDGARDVAAAVMSLITAQSYQTSVALAARLSPFEKFAANSISMCAVLRRHKEAAEVASRDAAGRGTLESHKTECQWRESERLWAEVVEGALGYGVRNAQVTAIAPTGTISLMMDCDTTGIEPELSLVKSRTLRDGAVVTQVNGSVPAALLHLGYAAGTAERAQSYLTSHGTLEGFRELLTEHLPIFDTALSPAPRHRISVSGHIAMLAAVQPHISGAISKTVNIPPSFLADEIYDALLLAWHRGLKSISFYRDTSKAEQPLRGTSSPQNKVSPFFFYSRGDS